MKSDSTRWAGILVGSGEVTLVLVDAPSDGSTPTLVLDQTIPLQTGDRPTAYAAMYARIQNVLKEKAVQSIAIKGSSVSTGGTTLGHLEACELRGVALAASAPVAHVIVTTKAKVTKSFGSRKADEYISDNEYWKGALEGGIRKGSREAALLVLAVK